MKCGYVKLTDKQLSDLIDLYECADPCSEYQKFMIYLALKELERNRRPVPHKYTVEELRELGGKPYYHVSLQGEANRYRILESSFAENPEDYHYDEYWVAYDRPPEEI